jgi:hypothetical protein
MTLRIKALSIVPVLLAVMAASLGLSAGQAQALPGTNATLSITPAPSSYSNVKLSGYVAMSRADAQEIVASKYTAGQWSIWGQDPFSDDFLDGPNLVQSFRASSRGLEFSETRVLKTSKLNEDWGEDEVYATIAIYTLKGKKFGTSNRVTGNF